jgi:hypothetical protein
VHDFRLEAKVTGTVRLSTATDVVSVHAKAEPRTAVNVRSRSRVRQVHNLNYHHGYITGVPYELEQAHDVRSGEMQRIARDVIRDSYGFRTLTVTVGFVSHSRQPGFEGGSERVEVVLYGRRD